MLILSQASLSVVPPHATGPGKFAKWTKLTKRLERQGVGKLFGMSAFDPLRTLETAARLMAGISSMANAWARDRATLFYLGFGLFGLLVVAFGFGLTYAAPMARGTFSAPWYVHLHGASAFAWVLLFIGQAVLVRARRTPLHRKIGKAGIPLAILVWASGITTAVWAAKRDVVELGTLATSALSGTVTGLSLFLILVIAAVTARRRADWHKRLGLLATIQVLWPAFFRLRHWFPSVPNPEVWFAVVLAYSPILLAAIRDRSRCGSVHPAWLFVALPLILEQSLEVASFDQGIQRAFGQWLFAFLA